MKIVHFWLQQFLHYLKGLISFSNDTWNIIILQSQLHLMHENMIHGGQNGIHVRGRLTCETELEMTMK